MPRCCLSSERSRCIDCMSLSTCSSMCLRWEDSCSSASYRFDQATESTMWSLPVRKLIYSWNATEVFMKCDWRVDGTTSAVLKSGFVWIRPLWTSRRLWSFEISCSRSYSQSSLNPLLACGQSVRPPSKSYLIPELNHCKSSPKPSAAQFQPSHVKCWRIPCCAEDLSPAATVALPRTPLSPSAAGPSPLLSLPPRTKSRTIQIEIKNIN